MSTLVGIAVFISVESILLMLAFKSIVYNETVFPSGITNSPSIASQSILTFFGKLLYSSTLNTVSGIVAYISTLSEILSKLYWFFVITPKYTQTRSSDFILVKSTWLPSKSYCRTFSFLKKSNLSSKLQFFKLSK